MSSRSLRYLAVIFVVLGIIASSSWWWTKVPGLSELGDPNKWPVAQFSVADVQQVIIHSVSGSELVLNRTGVGWDVNEYRAAQSLVSDLLNQLRSSKITTVVSRNADNFKTFGVSDEQATKITVKTTKDEISIWVGNSAQAASSYYVRVADAGPVYEVMGGLRQLAQQSVNEWRDKTVTNINESQVESMEVAIADVNYEITKADSGWQITRDGNQSELTGDQKTAIFTNLSPLSAIGFADATQEKVFSDTTSSSVIKVIKDDGQAVQVTLVKPTTGDSYVAQVTDDENFYMISSFVIDKFLLQ